MESAAIRSPCQSVVKKSRPLPLAQLGLGEAGVVGDENVEAEVLELRETPELFSAYHSLLL